jgi:hypothetical protein
MSSIERITLPSYKTADTTSQHAKKGWDFDGSAQNCNEKPFQAVSNRFQHQMCVWPHDLKYKRSNISSLIRCSIKKYCESDFSRQANDSNNPGLNNIVAAASLLTYCSCRWELYCFCSFLCPKEL